MPQLVPKLPNEQIKCLHLLGKALVEKEILTDSQKKLITNFIASSIDNHEFNQAILSNKRELTEQGIEPQVIDMMIDISFCTRRVRELDDALETFSEKGAL